MCVFSHSFSHLTFCEIGTVFIPHLQGTESLSNLPQIT